MLERLLCDMQSGFRASGFEGVSGSSVEKIFARRRCGWPSLRVRDFQSAASATVRRSEYFATVSSCSPCLVVLESNIIYPQNLLLMMKAHVVNRDCLRFVRGLLSRFKKDALGAARCYSGFRLWYVRK